MKTYDPLKSEVAVQGDLRESELTIDTAESATRHAALQQTTPPPGGFPLDALNDTMRAIAEETAAVYGLPPQLPAMAAVATFAGALGNAFRLKGAVNGRESNANVYVIAACPKSFGKGAAASVAEPLIERSAEIESEFEREVRPGLKVEKAILEAQLKKLLGKQTVGTSDTVNTSNARQQLADMQSRLDQIEPQLACAPTLYVSTRDFRGDGETIQAEQFQPILFLTGGR